MLHTTFQDILDGMSEAELMLGIFFLLSAVIAYVVTELSIAFALRRGFLDLPNPRSSHSDPMPRVGGIGILCGFYLSLAGVCLADYLGFMVDAVSLRYVLLVAIVGAGIAATGLYDDLRGLSPPIKFLLQAFFALLVVAEGIRLESLSVPLWGPVALGVFSIPLTIVWLAGFSNIYNFMDGINGLAGGTGFVYGCFLFLFAWLQGNQEASVVALLLAGSSLGFLFHNFPRARTFMGDTGSLFLGMLFALLVVQLAQRSATSASLTALLLVCSGYLYDTGFTVLRRLRHRENIFQAHRSHLYQRLFQAGFTHGKVTTLYLVLHTLVGVLALIYLEVSEAARLGILGLAFLVFLALTLGVGWRERRVARSGSVKGGHPTQFSQSADAER